MRQEKNNDENKCYFVRLFINYIPVNQTQF